jgi:hypothetical protein
MNIGRIELRDVDTVADYCIGRESVDLKVSTAGNSRDTVIHLGLMNENEWNWHHYATQSPQSGTLTGGQAFIDFGINRESMSEVEGRDR